MHSRTTTPWAYVALAALGLIGTKIKGQAKIEAPEPIAAIAADAPVELADSPGALLNEALLGGALLSGSLPSRTADAEADADLLADADPLQDRTKTAADAAGYIKWAPKYHRTVHPDERAYQLTPIDKLTLSLVSRLTLGEAASTVLGAGWSQLRNSRPN